MSTFSNEFLDMVAGVLDYLGDEALTAQSAPEFDEYRSYTSVDNAIKMWVSLGKQLDSNNEPHLGDCTGMPISCNRCLVEEGRARAKKFLIEFEEYKEDDFDFTPTRPGTPQ